MLSWITQSQPMTEFAMELFPPMLMCLPVAFSVLITVVLLAFTTVGGDGKLALPLTKAALVDPVLCIVVANLSVMASFGLYCLLFPFVFMGHIFGASIGLAIGIDGMLVMNSYLRRPLEKGSDPREAFIERFAAGAVAVTFTSISTAIAFLATAVSVFQMAYEIGICCALGVGFNWLFIVTFFGAAVAYLDQSAPPSATSSSDVSKLATQPLFEGPVARLVASTPGKLASRPSSSPCSWAARCPSTL